MSLTLFTIGIRGSEGPELEQEISAPDRGTAKARALEIARYMGWKSPKIFFVRETQAVTKNKSMETIRRAFPVLRRTNPTAIIHNGGARTIFGCLCGSTHTTSTDWKGRDASHVWQWRIEHADCGDRIAADLEAKVPTEMVTNLAGNIVIRRSK